MAVDFSKFDKMVDVEGLKHDIEEAQENTDDFKEVPLGTYEVAINKMELTESKKGDPMVTIWFKIVSGKFKNSLIFMNQVVTRGFQVHLVNDLLKSMETDVKVEFQCYSQYAQMLMDIHEQCDNQLEFALVYGERNGFKTFKITDVFEVD